MSESDEERIWPDAASLWFFAVLVLLMVRRLPRRRLRRGMVTGIGGRARRWPPRGGSGGARWLRSLATFIR